MAATEALGRPHARVTLGENDTPRRLRGREDDAPGCILGGLREAGVRNPVFLLEAIDRVAPDMAEALLDVLDPERCIAFEDQYVRVPFDLSAVLWIVTATDPDAIPEAVRDRLEVIALPGCTEQEKPAIAERHLLKRPFDARVPRSAGVAGAGAGGAVSRHGTVSTDVPTVVVEREVSSPAELEGHLELVGNAAPSSFASPTRLTGTRAVSGRCADCGPDGPSQS